MSVEGGGITGSVPLVHPRISSGSSWGSDSVTYTGDSAVGESTRGSMAGTNIMAHSHPRHEELACLWILRPGMYRGAGEAMAYIGVVYPKRMTVECLPQITSSSSLLRS
ncbi:hypothetical protein Tco_0908825 [Tanacetum coccineum]|uniref:Uncharacterized protein n=1 Tax=Tanacetum coccineum TaxID=301880 RepID=A0ABQ5CNE7_9ASTR